MALMKDVSTQDLAILAKLFSDIPQNSVIPLDPNDPDHHAAIQLALASAGRTTDRYPTLNQQSNDGTNVDTSTADQVQFVAPGIDRAGRASAHVWQVAGGGHVKIMGSSLYALNENNDELLGFGANANVSESMLTAAINSKTASKVDKDQLHLLNISHSVDADGTTRFTGAARSVNLNILKKTQIPNTAMFMASSAPAMATAASAMSAGIQSNVLLPVSSRNRIIIGLGRRSGQNPDVDYRYNEQGGSPTNPYLIVPFKGNTPLPFEISNAQPGQPISGATYASKVYFVSAGGNTSIANVNATYTPDLGAKVTAADSYTVQWDFPYDQDSYQNTQSIVYNPLALVNDKSAYFYFEFNIPLVTGDTATFYVCSLNTPEEPSLNCTQIKDLKFTWHCLAADTQILMADGGTMPISDLTNEHRVRSGQSVDLAVEATTYGSHSSSANSHGPGAVYRLVLANGRELVATGAHPIMTSYGFIRICDLAWDQETIVMTLNDGGVPVELCEPIDYEGVFYNLKLGNHSDRSNGFAEKIANYVANGVIVGDSNALRHHHEHVRTNIDYMRPRLHQDLHTDYASAISDIKY